MKLLTVSAAAGVLGIPANTLLHRIHRGAIPVARYEPMRFRLADVLAYSERMPAVRPYGGRPRIADTLARDMTSKLDKITTGV